MAQISNVDSDASTEQCMSTYIEVLDFGRIKTWFSNNIVLRSERSILSYICPGPPNFVRLCDQGCDHEHSSEFGGSHRFRRFQGMVAQPKL